MIKIIKQYLQYQNKQLKNKNKNKCVFLHSQMWNDGNSHRIIKPKNVISEYNTHTHSFHPSFIFLSEQNKTVTGADNEGNYIDGIDN